MNDTPPRRRICEAALRYPVTLLTAVTVCKILAFVGLAAEGRVGTFVGHNAANHYIPIADRLLTEGRFNGPDSRPDSKVPIGYPAVLAVVKFVAGDGFLPAVVCVQMAADLAVAVLLYGLGALVGQRGAGVTAGLAWLVYPPAVILSTWITAETLFTGLLFASLLLLTAAVRRGTVRLFVAAGVVLGVATLFRGTCLLLPVALAPLWLARTLPRGWLHGLAFTAGMGVVVVPWAVRNRVVLDDTVIVSVGFGSVVLQGSHPDVFTIEGKEAHYPEMFAAADAAGVARPTSDRESEGDGWALRVGLRNYEARLRDEPLSMVPFAGQKFVRLWYGTESGSRRTQLALLACSILVVPAAVWQFVRWRHHLPNVSRLYLLVTLYFVALHTVTLPEYRYMHPLFPLLVFGAAIALVGRRARGAAPGTPGGAPPHC